VILRISPIQQNLPYLTYGFNKPSPPTH
jgi:hypothetical protein